MRTAFFTTAVAVLALSTSAMAADLVLDEAPIAAVPEISSDYWTGFYAGVHGGYATGSVSAVNAFVVPGPATADVTGWLAGLQAGYNVNLGGFVLGAEADVAWSNATGDTGLVFAGNGATFDIDWLGSVRGRAGVALDSVLLYATAGIGFAGGSSTISGALLATPANASATHTGWVAGAGAELMVAENVSLKAEYLYYALGSSTYTYTGGLGTTAEVSGNIHTVKVGANFHF